MRIVLLLLLCSGSALADSSLYLCNGPGQPRKVQDHPCGTSVGASPQGFTVMHLGPVRPVAKDPGCNVYAQDEAFAMDQDRATSSNSIGALWSDRIQRDRDYLRDHGCAK